MKRSVNALGILCVGVSAMITQIVFLREVLRLLSGNELVVGLFLCLWMFLTGAGSFLGGIINFRERTYQWFHDILWFFLGVLPLLLLIGFRAVYHNYSLGITVGLNATFITALLVLGPYCILSGFLLSLLAGSMQATSEKTDSGSIRQVYFLDSAGSVIGGVFFSLVLVHFFAAIPVLTILLIVNMTVAFLLSLSANRKISASLFFFFLSLSLVGIYLAKPDRATSQWVYSGDLLFARSTPYGELALTRQNSQFTIFRNGVPAGSSGDHFHAEWAVHPALAQIQEPRHVLILGILSGSINEVLKHNPERIDCVESDKVVLNWTKKFYNLEDSEHLRFISNDYRSIITQSVNAYDAILMDLPDPVSAQWNRFYTVEFFEKVRTALRPGGVFSFQLKGAANYANPELRKLQSSIYQSISAVFPQVLLLPGEKTGFLASNDPMDYQIASSLAQRGIHSHYMTEAYLSAAFTRDRLADIDKIRSLGGHRNYDFLPAAYFIYLEFWLSSFGSSLLVPFLFAIALGVVLVILVSRQKCLKESIVLTTTGFTGMGLEMILLVAFQVSFGSLYQHIGLVLAAFLAGTTLGALGKAKETVSSESRHLVQTEIALVLFGILLLPLVFLMREAADLSLSPWFGVLAFSFLNGVIGYIAGSQFKTIAGRLEGNPRKGFGYLFAIDLFGACLGALLVTSILLPLLGLTKVCLILVMIKCASLFLLSRNPSPVSLRLEEKPGSNLTRWLGAGFAVLVLSLTGFFIVLESSHGVLYDFTLSKVYHAFLLILLGTGILQAMGLKIPYHKVLPTAVWNRWTLFKKSMTSQTGVEPSRWLTYLVFSVALFYPLFRCYFHVPYLLCHVCPRKCVFGWLRPYLIPAALVMNMEKRFWCYHVCPVGTLHHCESCATHTAKRRPGWFVIVPLSALFLTAVLYFVIVRDFEYPDSGGVNWFFLFFKNSFSFSGYVFGFLVIMLLLGLRWWRPFCESLCPIGMFSELYLKLEGMISRSRKTVHSPQKATVMTGESSQNSPSDDLRHKS